MMLTLPSQIWRSDQSIFRWMKEFPQDNFHHCIQPLAYIISTLSWLPSQFNVVLEFWLSPTDIRKKGLARFSNRGNKMIASQTALPSTELGYAAILETECDHRRWGWCGQGRLVIHSLTIISWWAQVSNTLNLIGANSIKVFPIISHLLHNLLDYRWVITTEVSIIWTEFTVQ